MHNALFVIAAAVYYNNSQKLLGRAAEFNKYIPEAAIILVAAGVGSGLSCLKVLTAVSRSSPYFGLSHSMAMFRAFRWSQDILTR